MKNFRTFQLAVQLCREVQGLKISGPARNQLHGATLSIALNLAEAKGRQSQKDQHRFFHIAMGSVREVQAIFVILEVDNPSLCDRLDHVAASLHRLIHGR